MGSPYLSWGRDEKLGLVKQSPLNWWFQVAHHRINSEFEQCYNEHILWEHCLACKESILSIFVGAHRYFDHSVVQKSVEIFLQFSNFWG